MEEKNSVFSDEMFELLTRYTCETDRADYKERRAELLGLGGRHVVWRRARSSGFLKNRSVRMYFIGLYTYLNGDVTIGDHVLIGPHCTLPAGNHLFDAQTGYFSARTTQNNAIVIGDGCWLASGVTVTAVLRWGNAIWCAPMRWSPKAHRTMLFWLGHPAKQIGEIDPENR